MSRPEISFIGLILISGCVSHTAVETTHDQIAGALEPGDRVKVELTDGTKMNLRVLGIHESELVGDTSTDITKGEIVKVQYDDIERLEKLGIDKKPLVIVGAATASYFAVLTVLFLLAGASLTL
jgi:hypothetical protein